MAIAKVELTCAECGKTFVWRTEKRNRKTADEWEAWAQNQTRICPECYRNSRNADELSEYAETCAALSLPELTGKSEKQISYAHTLRSKWMRENQQTIQKYQNCCKQFAVLTDAEKAELLRKTSTETDTELWSAVLKRARCEMVQLLKDNPDAATVIKILNA